MKRTKEATYSSLLCLLSPQLRYTCTSLLIVRYTLLSIAHKFTCQFLSSSFFLYSSKPINNKFMLMKLFSLLFFISFIQCLCSPVLFTKPNNEGPNSLTLPIPPPLVPDCAELTSPYSMVSCDSSRDCPDSPPNFHNFHIPSRKQSCTSK